MLVYGPYLFELNHRQNMVIADPADIYMRRLPGILFDPGRDRRYDQGGTVPVADIVLKNDDRPLASLLGSLEGIQVCQVDISPAVYPVCLHEALPPV